jgi:hypothetical protein
MLSVLILGIYYVSREEERILEENKEIQKTKKSLKDLDKIISPEMHAFVNVNLPVVSLKYNYQL